MLKKLVIMTLIVSILTLVTGCNQDGSSGELEAKELLEEFFSAHNDKDIEQMNRFLTKDRQSIQWEIDKLNYIKIIEIYEDDDGEISESYLTYGRGQEINPFEVQSYRVKFEIDFEGGFGSGLTNGVHEWNYTLIKETEESKWLIDDWGNG